jgi:hypothetical protein
MCIKTEDTKDLEVIDRLMAKLLYNGRQSATWNNSSYEYRLVD